MCSCFRNGSGVGLDRLHRIRTSDAKASGASPSKAGLGAFRLPASRRNLRIR
jgi:hypothetical protein